MSIRMVWAPMVLAGLIAGFAAVTNSFESAVADGVQQAKTEAAQPPAEKKGKKQAGKKKAGKAVEYPPPPPSAEEAGVPILSAGDSYDDFPSIAQTSDGTLFAAYAAYYDGHDQIRLHKLLPEGEWSTRTYVPLVQPRSDIWMPQLAVDASDNVWVIWCEQTGQSRGKSGNWDLYARALMGDSWGPIVRLTDDPKPDINPFVATDEHRNIYVTWQAHPDNTGDIQLCRFDGKGWSKPLAVTKGTDSDWYPRLAVDKQGVVWIAFDSYRNRDYDVFLTRVEGTKVGETVPIATSKYYEAHASVACTDDGKVWVAWEQGGFQWGKDQGHWLNRYQQERRVGSPLGSERSVQIAAYSAGKVLRGPSVEDALDPQNQRRLHGSAALVTGPHGRLWLRFRLQKIGGQRAPGRTSRYWSEQITHLTGSGWSKPIELAGSSGRISVFSRIMSTKDGGLVAAYSADRRGAPNFHMPQRDQVLISSLSKPADDPGIPQLSAYEPPAPPAGINVIDPELEAGHVAAIRAYRTRIDGTEHRIVRGDLHRHTELSWDVGPGNDGSYLDFYRYMIDVAAMDFGGLSDHQGGGHYAYWWWLTEKSADMYYLAPRFVPLYGYERSASFPNGHRNIFHSYRGVPVFPFQTKLNSTGVFPGIGAGNLVENDTKLLYSYLHSTGGIAISHTSGTSTMGTDWRDNDPAIEPVVEIYQGARNSYETLGGPRVHPGEERPEAAPGGFQDKGMVWNAYQKGYRLGTITSSDHGSTHISYALVYVPNNDRAEILDAIRKRHTYGGTDNLIVAFRANGRFMGDEFESADKPALELEATGTGTIAKIDIVRNNEYVFSTDPGKAADKITYVDMQPARGTNLYYCRIQQANGEVAWCSPIWVKAPAK